MPLLAPELVVAPELLEVLLVPELVELLEPPALLDDDEPEASLELDDPAPELELAVTPLESCPPALASPPSSRELPLPLELPHARRRAQQLGATKYRRRIAIQTMVRRNEQASDAVAVERLRLRRRTLRRG
jgi:hypothetical protein